MSVNWKFTTEFNMAILDEWSPFSPLAEPGGFQLQNQLTGKAIVDLGEIHIVRRHARHRKPSRRAVVQAHFEYIVPVRKVMRRIGMPRSDSHYVDWPTACVDCALSGCHQEGRRTVCFEATIKQAVGMADPS